MNLICKVNTLYKESLLKNLLNSKIPATSKTRSLEENIVMGNTHTIHVFQLDFCHLIWKMTCKIPKR